MSELEDPVATVVRLLQKNVQVVKDDGSIASINVSREWCDRELFKSCDGQITVGLAESTDAKLEMSGRLRRRLGALRVNAWATDKPATFESGRTLRNKIVEEVNRVIRQNRNKPSETIYDFVSLGPTGDTHKAYHSGSASEVPPGDLSWVELTSADYEELWHSDDSRYSKSHNVNNEYALTLLRFKTDSRQETVEQIILAFEGYGTAPSGNGVTIKVRNHTAQEWQHAQTGTGGADETVTITLTSGLADFIDGSGYVWLLARTTSPSNGSTPATLHCDYVSCTVTVKGLTHVDVVSFRDADRVDVKPFIFRTEFTLKSWCFEDIGGIF